MTEERIMARMAELFYVYDMSQYKLAEKFGYSKSKVCRILKDAKKRGIIKFRIEDFNRRVLELERATEERFGVREALIYYNSDFKDNDNNMNFKEVGRMAAEYIERILKDDINIALTWGKTLYSFAREINPDSRYKINTFSTLGGINLSKSEYQNNNIVKMFSEKAGGEYYHIYLPLMVPDPGQRDMLLRETGINKVLGDTDLGINDRIINLSIDEIRKIKNKVLIAHGKEKVKSIISFLKTGITDILITDSLTVEEILKNG